MQWLIERLELSRGGTQNMLPMEGLRGVAVFLVFLVHFCTLSNAWFAGAAWLLTLIQGVRALGNAGVDLFFILSGYLIYAALMRRPQRFGTFVAHRLRRIYPAFLTVFALYLLLGFAMPSLSKLPSTNLPLFLIGNLLLLPGLFPITPLITVAWSLSYELFFYLVIPLLITSMRLRAWSAGRRIAAMVGVCCPLFAYWGAAGGHPQLAMFVAGMMLRDLLCMTQWRPPAAAALFVACTAGLLEVVPTIGPLGFTLKVLALFFGFGLLCWSCIALPDSWLGRSLSWAPLRWLGNISYSYYLVHSLGLQACFLLAPTLLPAQPWGALGGALLLPLSFTLTLIPSLLLYLTVERPISLAPGLGRRGRLDTVGSP